MVMANLPARQTDSSEPLEFQRIIAEQLAAGKTPIEIARKLHPDNPKKRYALRRRIMRMAQRDARMARAVEDQVKGEILLGTPAIVVGLIKRAQRGRTDAAKLLFEMSGMHNPKVKHEHSGDVAIKVTFDRPPPVEGTATQITDAEVVED